MYIIYYLETLHFGTSLRFHIHLHLDPQIIQKQTLIFF